MDTEATINFNNINNSSTTFLSLTTGGIYSLYENKILQKLFENTPYDIIGFEQTRISHKTQIKTSALADYFTSKGYLIYTNIPDEPTTEKQVGIYILSKFKGTPSKDFTLIEQLQITFQSLSLEFDNFLLIVVGKPHSGENLKNKEARQIYDKLFFDYVKKSKDIGKKIIIMGNFNAIIDPFKDKTQNYGSMYAGQTQDQIAGLKKLVALGFVDTFRKKHPYEIKYTQQNFYNKKVPNQDRKLRTDYIFVDEEFKELIEEADILTSVQFNQHFPVTLKINLKPNLQ